MSSRYVIRQARVLGGEPTDIAIEGGVITAIGTDLAAPGATEVDAAGLIALPGLVDLHTHLREPGREDAETVLTGTQAAARGGFTCVHAMANTDPVADTAGVVEQVWRLGREGGYCDVQPVGAVTVGLGGTQLAELGAMADSAANVRVFSDDGKCVSDAVLMRRALEYVKAFDGVVAQHAQEPRLTEGAQMNEGLVSGELGLTGWPAAAEEAIVARDCVLAAHVGSRLHVCHLSTRGSVEIVRWAKSKGWDVTAEVTPHHLLLTDDLVRGYDPIYKVNPPLRTHDDVAALRLAVADGTIDALVSDHTPVDEDAKDLPFAESEPGATGLELLLSLALKWSQDCHVSLTRALAVLTSDAARVLGSSLGTLQASAGKLVVGGVADVCVFDPATEWVVEPQALRSQGKHTPFSSYSLPGKVRCTVVGGLVAFQA